MLSASGVWAAKKCLLSAILPQDAEDNETLRAGTRAHAAIAEAVTRAWFEQLDTAGMDADTGAQLINWWIWRWEESADLWEGRTAYPEIGIAFSPERMRARLIPPRDPLHGYRDASLADDEIACTIDVALTGDKYQIHDIVEWKTTTAVEILPEEGESWDEQMRTYAAAWSTLHDDVTTRSRLVRVGVDTVREGPATVHDCIDVAAITSDLASLVSRIREARAGELPKPQPGSHCRRCKALGNCPAALKAASVAVWADNPTVQLRVPQDGVEAGRILDSIVMAKKYLANLERAIHDWVDQQPGSLVELGDGRVAAWESVAEARRIDMSAVNAHERLERIFGASIDSIAPRKAQMKHIVSYVRDAALTSPTYKRGDIAAKKRAILAELETAGLLSPRGKTYRRFAIKKQKGTPGALLEDKLRQSLSSPDDIFFDGGDE